METEPEIAALYEGAALIDLSGRTQVQLTGADRASFLHNLCTNEIRKLPVGQGCEAFLTNAQGKILFHIWVFCLADFLVLETMPGESPRLLAHLDRYRIREKVEWTDQSQAWCQLSLAGPKAAAVLESIGIAPRKERLAHIEGSISGVPVQVRRVDLTVPPGFFIVGPSERQADVQQAIVQAGAVPTGSETLEIARIEAGFPFYGIDITEDNLPQEVARDQRAISFVKGCYIGQETVARIDALGHVNKNLCGIRFAGVGGAPQPGMELSAGGKVVGRITSAAFHPRHAAWLALGYVRRGTNLPGQSLQTAAGEAEVARLPFSVG